MDVDNANIPKFLIQGLRYDDRKDIRKYPNHRKAWLFKNKENLKLIIIKDVIVLFLISFQNH